MILPAPLDDVAPICPPTLVEQCHVHIDDQLATLAESMRALRSRRNSLAPIACLPPEILVTVFKLIVEKGWYRTYRRNYHYCTVTHVCRHWRRVALECPGLWAFINGTSTRWIGLMLERSKKAPLVVTCHASALPSDCLGKVLSQLPRIKVLRLELYMRDANRVLDYLLVQPAPLLQIFKFSLAGGGIPVISDAIFQGQAPQLRDIQLTCCSFSWTSRLFSGLRTLDLEGIASSASSCTLQELLAALRRMPGLEQLKLEPLSIISESNNIPFDRVPLACLKRIVLDATIQTAVALFSRLALPDDARVALNLTKIEGPQSFSDLFSAMDKGPGKFGPVLRSLRATLSYPSLIQFSTSMKYAPPSPRTTGDVCLSIEFQSDTEIRPPIIFDICRMITQDPIHILSLSYCATLDTSFWHTASAHFPKLEEIHVSTSYIGCLLDELRIGGTEGTNIAYRSLRVLGLRDIEFLEGEAENLRDILHMRGGLCAFLDKLQLTECNGLNADDVGLLQEVVGCVEWDGNEEPLESERES
ncbi:hypothetical protein M405DRAFT_802319 [Rhizopogon salebrosus TDB-379]|nr:hypothetical protein M405DRAFT_802319 [Rhizopogon salebrosus TDB-379]